MADLAELKSERSRIRRSFTNVSKKLEDLLEKVDKTDADLTEISSLMQMLDLRNSELQDKNDLILTAMKMGNPKEKEINAEQDKVDEMLMSYLRYKTAVGKLVNPIFADDKSISGVSGNSQTSSNNSKKRKKYKLPILQLREFGGELKDWLPFWSQFSKFDEDEDMENDDKLGYLTQCMVKGSPARALVDSYPATGKMYSSVVKALKDRYGREDLLTEFYIRELLQIVILNASSREKLPIVVLYDRLQSHLRNLEVLGVTMEKCAAILLPMVSSCLPDDLYKAWDRNCAPNVKRTNPDATSKDFLDSLLTFLSSEVEGDQKFVLSRTGFGLPVKSGTRADKADAVGPNRQRKGSNSSDDLPTAASLLTATKSTGISSCIFCGARHSPQDCHAALKLTLEQRREKVSGAKACFCCLQRNHIASHCRNRPKCVTCDRHHFLLMCDRVPKDSTPAATTPSNEKKPVSDPVEDVALANVSSHCGVLMQTLVVSVRGSDGRTRRARLLIDSASHRSYVLSATALEMGYLPCRQEAVKHSLFGGGTTGVVNHNVFRLYLSNLDETYRCNFEVLEQSKICGYISPVVDGPWIQELGTHNVKLSDTGVTTDIEILVGADIAAKLWTGKRIPLSSGLVAMETSLGWTLSGRVPNVGQNSLPKITSHETTHVTMVTSMLNKEAILTDLRMQDKVCVLSPLNDVLRKNDRSDGKSNRRLKIGGWELSTKMGCVNPIVDADTDKHLELRGWEQRTLQTTLNPVMKRTDDIMESAKGKWKVVSSPDADQIVEEETPGAPDRNAASESGM